jgi:hypothetical protein
MKKEKHVRRRPSEGGKGMGWGPRNLLETPLHLGSEVRGNTEDVSRNFFGPRSLSNLDPRRAQERSDGHMIREDQTAMANLSPIAIHREYPRYSKFANILLDEVIFRSRDED